MTIRSARLAFATAFVLALSPAAFAQTKAPVIQPALDGIMEAFKTHPLFGLASAHGVAQEQDLWLAIVRDPRFAREVGNVVVEGGDSANQALMDRYVNGEDVSYAELRNMRLPPSSRESRSTSPGISDNGHAYLFATIRELNAALPADQRIKVWLGEPIHLLPDLIVRDILDKKKKALVIYGGGHFTRDGMTGGSMRTGVEQKYPGAFFVAATYTRLANPACAQRFEQAFQNSPTPALVTSIVGTPLEAQLTGPDCRPPSGVVVMTGPGATPEQQAQMREAQAAINKSMDDLMLGGLLYVGPSSSLTRAGSLPEAYIDPEYRKEMARRGLPVPKVPSALSPSRFVPASEEQRLAAFKAADRDGDGRLDKAAYREVLVATGNAWQLDTLFAQRDANKDGFVSADELRTPIPQ